MAYADDVARYQKAGLAADFHWWPADYAKEMLAGLLDALAREGEGARLVCRPGLKEDGVVTLWLAVEHDGPTPEGHNGVYDQSHPCPPFCP